MKPVLTATEMAEVDAAAADRMDQLVRRAGSAVASAARAMLGRTSGRRVHVMAGPGNNGADGRVAAAILRRRGALVTVSGPRTPPPSDVDLVIDAAFGTGLSRSFVPPPAAPGVPVLAVDVPSGLDATTGVVGAEPWRADRTVTFAAWKSGMLLGAGPRLVGEVELTDIGLTVDRVVGDGDAVRRALMEDGDLERWPRRPRDAHKWHSAVWVLGGVAGMTGAAALAARAAARAGAGYVQWSVPPTGGLGSVPPTGGLSSVSLRAEGVSLPPPVVPDHIVRRALPLEDWVEDVVAETRVGAIVVGNGLGRSPDTVAAAIGVVRRHGAAMVVDADLLSVGGEDLIAACRSRSGPTVLTPHDAEFTRLFGESGDDVGGVVRAAQRSGAVVMRKGPTTVVAAPDGRVRFVTAGDRRLATAGTGDVLAGVVAAGLACGAGGLEAAAVGALLHGRAAHLCSARGMVASDLPDAIPSVLDALEQVP